MSDVTLMADALANALALGSDVALCASLADTLAGELRADTRSPSLEAAYPALERWRRFTLEEGGSALEVAAAWELTALACHREGQPQHADACLANAHKALGFNG